MRKMMACLFLLFAMSISSGEAGSTGGGWIVSGSKTTDEFSAFRKWRIRWNLLATEHGTAYIFISVCDKTTGNPIEFASSHEAGVGETVVHQTGHFYLDISVVGKAKVWIE